MHIKITLRPYQSHGERLVAFNEQANLPPLPFASLPVEFFLSIYTLPQKKLQQA